MTARLSAAEEACLAEFAAQVRALLGPRVRRVVLFGSRARGSGRDDSDLDVLVEVERLTPKERGAVIDLGTDLGLRHRLVLSPLVAVPGGVAPPLLAEVARDGVAW